MDRLEQIKNEVARENEYPALHIAEGGEHEAQNLNLKQMFNRSTTVHFSTNTPLLAICCYMLCFKNFN